MTGQRAEIKLPLPPSTNQYWRCVRARLSAHVLLSKQGRSYRETVKKEVLAQRVPAFGDKKTAVYILLCAPDARPRDLDNYLKGLLDALTKAGVWDDDRHIDLIAVRRGEISPKNGHIIVEINEAEE